MSNDVTDGYIIRDVERLRKPMQLISNFLVKHMGYKRHINEDSVVTSHELVE